MYDMHNFLIFFDNIIWWLGVCYPRTTPADQGLCLVTVPTCITHERNPYTGPMIRAPLIPPDILPQNWNHFSNISNIENIGNRIGGNDRSEGSQAAGWSVSSDHTESVLSKWLRNLGLIQLSVCGKEWEKKGKRRAARMVRKEGNQIWERVSRLPHSPSAYGGCRQRAGISNWKSLRNSVKKASQVEASGALPPSLINL